MEKIMLVTRMNYLDKKRGGKFVYGKNEQTNKWEKIPAAERVHHEMTRNQTVKVLMSSGKKLPCFFNSFK